MIDALHAIDTHVFLWINHWPHAYLFDSFAHLLSGVEAWGVIWVLIILVLFFREEIRDRIFFIPFVAAAFFIGLSEVALKWIVARPRPTVDMGAIMYASAENYSFPSTHATAAFAFAYVCARVDPAIRVWVYILASLIGLSRVYLGVHYPFDILAGAILGIIIGWSSIQLENYARAKWIRRSSVRSKKIQ
jgi:undecaprenyl-diphosphatase